MKNSLYDRIWRRESGEASPYASIRGLYGSKEWIDNLDIVNELGGHTGCVNALSWSRSGKLLASGSDDHHLNIYSYQPDSSTAPFSLNTTVFTGHRANIFSVKFMPHSNDRTVVTCAGDSQVRVFDIEYSNTNRDVAATSAFSASARSRRFNNFFNNTRYLNEGNTNARVYRSHSDRVKRIVTESSPNLFLTCSEDGEVRQWDLRQPSIAYPKPRGGQGFMAVRQGMLHDDSNVPPPLISYKRHQLDLNTISCSPSQPHYIALGGAHLHCFLHDRRMLGRDLLAEKGDPGNASPAASNSNREDETMGQATKCVKRFAPRGKRRMSPHDEGHITACKISDANPNEMVVSWSGDHIYSFDLLRSPGAAENDPSTKSIPVTHNTRSRHSKDKKRKRQKKSSSSSESSGNQRQSLRRSSQRGGESELRFHLRYGNGDSEDVPMSSLADSVDNPQGNIFEHARNSVLTDAQKLSMDIAKGLVKLRKMLFSLDADVREVGESSSSDLTSFNETFSTALTQASIYLPKMNEVMLTWGYPMHPSPETVRTQNTLSQNRQSAWRFVQAAGTLARALGGEIPESLADEQVSSMFQEIKPAPREDPDIISRESLFAYDFLKAVILFFEGGRNALLSDDGFKRDLSKRRHQNRFPVSENAENSAVELQLIPYLQDLATETPVVNVDASRFEHDSTRILFPTQHAAVNAFSNVVKLPLEDLDNSAARVEADGESNESSQVRSLDRNAAKRFWLLRVGRGILMTAGQGVNYAFTNQAFGGLNMRVGGDSSDTDGIEQERNQDDTEANLSEEPIQDIEVRENSDSSNLVQWQSENGLGPSSRGTQTPADGEADNHGNFFDIKEIGGEHEVDGQSGSVEDDESDEDEEDDDEEEEGEDSDEEEDDDDENVIIDGMSETSDVNVDDDGSDESEESNLRSMGLRRTRRQNVNIDVPCEPHTRVYRGHCNVKTVKDVNFYGLNDEYVVSGSDCGNLFIWDRKTCELVNILEGDSEVVNVVQGHPYEPTIAASGIDNTIKVFSPDRYAQDNARRGINVLDPDNPANMVGSEVKNIGGLGSRKRMQDSYKIMSQNDVDRQGGLNDAYITRNMLAQFAATLRNRQNAGEGAPEGGEIVLDDNCNVM